MANKNGGIKIAAQNKKAYHDYFVEEKYEAGIELFGTEVKSLRAGKVNLKDSFCKVYEFNSFFFNHTHFTLFKMFSITKVIILKMFILYF